MENQQHLHQRIKELIQQAAASKATELDLSGYYLTSLPTEIKQLSQLKTLHLNDNNLQSLPNEVGGLKSLEYLNLANNGLHDLPADFRKLSQLKVLHLSYNHYVEIPRTVFKCQKLEELLLEHNEITDVNDDIQQLKALQTLDLKKNKLTRLTDAIGQLKKLCCLDVRGNLLSEIPSVVCELEQLAYLYLNGNHLDADLIVAAASGLDAIQAYFKQKSVLNAIQNAKDNQLFKLDLSDRGITELPATLFELKDLKILSLEGNELWDVPDAIKQLQSLEVLDLSNNQLVNVPDILKEMPNLKIIETEGNPVAGSSILPKVVYLQKEVNKKIKAAKAAQADTLDLSNCGLTRIPKAIFELSQLRKLILGRTYKDNERFKHRNYITTLPKELVALEQLETLDLSGNAIVKIEEEISQMAIKELNLVQNGLKKLPKGMQYLQQHLVRLDVSNNDIQDLPNDFEQFQQLQYLNISNNAIPRLPNSIFKCNELRELRAAHLKIKQLPEEVEQLGVLQVLDISNNQLRELPDTIVNLRKLQYLEVAHNQLNSLPGKLHELRFTLEHLNVSRNQLTALPVGIRHMLSLQTLNIQHNQLNEFPDGVTALRKLETLDISHNKLTNLPRIILELHRFGHLTKLETHHNQFEKSFYKASKNGLEGIQEWYDYQDALQAIQKAKSEKSEVLDLSDFSLKHVPREVLELNNLKILRLGRHYQANEDTTHQNNISQISKKVVELEQLEELHAPANAITELPAEVGQLRCLRVLDVADNQIKALPPQLADLQHLEVLNVNHNLLRTLPLEFAFFKNLQAAHWNLNDLQPPFDALSDLDTRSSLEWLMQQYIQKQIETARNPKVKTLNLAHCTIKTLPPEIFELEHLEVLEVPFNAITALPKDIARLRRLRKLNVHQNQLQTLPLELADLRYLETVQLSDNPLQQLPSVFQQTPLDWLDVRLWLDQQRINEELSEMLAAYEGVQTSPLYNRGRVNCQICHGQRYLTGYDAALGIQFYQQTCYGCNGSGQVSYELEDIHHILNDTDYQLFNHLKRLKGLLQQKQSFERSTVFAVQPNAAIQPSLSRILQRFNDQIQQLQHTFAFYSDIQARLKSVLYHQHMLYSAIDEFKKIDHIESGLNMNFEEKAAIQRDILNEMHQLQDHIHAARHHHMVIHPDFLQQVEALIGRYRTLLRFE